MAEMFVLSEVYSIVGMFSGVQRRFEMDKD